MSEYQEKVAYSSRILLSSMYSLLSNTNMEASLSKKLNLCWQDIIIKNIKIYYIISNTDIVCEIGFPAVASTFLVVLHLPHCHFEQSTAE
jgi:hypothetical protein